MLLAPDLHNRQFVLIVSSMCLYLSDTAGVGQLDSWQDCRLEEASDFTKTTGKDRI